MIFTDVTLLSASQISARQGGQSTPLLGLVPISTTTCDLTTHRRKTVGMSYVGKQLAPQYGSVFGYLAGVGSYGFAAAVFRHQVGSSWVSHQSVSLHAEASCLESTVSVRDPYLIRGPKGRG